MKLGPPIWAHNACKADELLPLPLRARFQTHNPLPPFQAEYSHERSAPVSPAANSRTAAQTRSGMGSVVRQQHGCPRVAQQRSDGLDHKLEADRTIHHHRRILGRNEQRAARELRLPGQQLFSFQRGACALIPSLFHVSCCLLLTSAAGHPARLGRCCQRTRGPLVIQCPTGRLHRTLG
jgi:hypothetical protein